MKVKVTLDKSDVREEQKKLQQAGDCMLKMARSITIRILVKVDKMNGGAINGIEHRAKEDVGVMKNSMVDGYMKTGTDVVMIINSNLRITSRRG